MNEHPINGLIEESLKNIRQMVDVDTIVGEPIRTDDGTVIIPISKVSFGFGSGGSEFSAKKPSADNTEKPLFGGGAGAGVSISPIAFLVVSSGEVKLIPMTSGGGAIEKLVDYIPYAFDKINSLIKKKDVEEKTE